MNEANDLKQINKFNIIANIIYLIFILLIFFGSFVRNDNTVILSIGFVVVSAISYGIVMVSYLRDKGNPRVKYLLAIAFFVVYLYIMLVGDATFRFALVFAPLALMILYHSSGFILGLGIAAIAINVLNVLVCYFVFNRTDAESMSRYWIQLVTVIFTLAASWAAAGIYSRSYNRIQAQTSQLERMSLQTIETIANTIDAKDAYTQGHSKRVAEYSIVIAKKLGMDEETQEKIGNIASLHDVGKIAVPDTVLNKPARLSDEEYELMKTHTTAGAEILKDIDSIPDIALGAKFHHERYDGKGYPEGLKGEEIPIVARIIGLADAFDAMTSNRIYRPPLTKEAVIEQIELGRGTQFDPKCVDVFIDYAKNLDIYNYGEDLDSKQRSSVVNDTDEDSKRDELTGAYNRIFGENQLSLMLTREYGALVLVDIVGLKEINMEYGFRRGDHYLKVVYDCLSKTKIDNGNVPYVIRFEGNEFLLFLEDCDTKEKAEAWIKDFLQKLEDVESKDKFIEKKLGVSCSVTLHDNMKKDITFHVRQLHQSLYLLKKNGDNEYCIYEDNEKLDDVFAARDDIDDLVNIIKNQDPNMLTSIMGERDVSKSLSVLFGDDNGNSENTLLILFTAKPENSYSMSMERRQKVMGLLDEAIIMSVGDDGLLSSYSSLQRIAMIRTSKRPQNGWDEYINQLENNVLSNFHKNYDKFDMEIKCSYRIME